MSTLNEEKGHNYYQDLLGIAALGFLETDERVELDAHLAGCELCRSEYAELIAAVGVLPLALDEVMPSPALRDRLEAAIAADAAPLAPQLVSPDRRPIDQGEAPPDAEPTNLRWFSGTAAKVLSVAAAVILVAVAAVTIVLNLRSTESQTIDIAVIPADVSATLTYQPDDEVFKLEVDGMPEPPSDHVYQVWLIAGESPESVGVMSGSEFEVSADRDQYDAFAITVEPGPDGSPGPTTDPIVVAPLHPESNDV